MERRPLPGVPISSPCGHLGQALTPLVGAPGGRLGGGQRCTGVRRGQGDQCILFGASREPNPARELGQPAGRLSAHEQRCRANRWASSRAAARGSGRGSRAGRAAARGSAPMRLLARPTWRLSHSRAGFRWGAWVRTRRGTPIRSSVASGGGTADLGRPPPDVDAVVDLGLASPDREPFPVARPVGMASRSQHQPRTAPGDLHVRILAPFHGCLAAARE